MGSIMSLYDLDQIINILWNTARLIVHGIWDTEFRSIVLQFGSCWLTFLLTNFVIRDIWHFIETSLDRNNRAGICGFSWISDYRLGFVICTHFYRKPSNSIDYFDNLINSSRPPFFFRASIYRYWFFPLDNLVFFIVKFHSSQMCSLLIYIYIYYIVLWCCWESNLP